MTYEAWLESFLKEHVDAFGREKARIALQAFIALVQVESRRSHKRKP